MADLGAIEEDVKFDWDTARQLSTQLRTAAAELDGQIPHRNAIAQHAKREWRGRYAGKFTDRMSICTGDAARLADALRRAANQLDELSQLAHEEQHRRELARAWKVEHDAWEEHQKHRGVLEQVGDFFGGDDEPKPPVGPPKTVPTYTIEAPTAGSRE
jgi:uncharacterized protein YukE